MQSTPGNQSLLYWRLKKIADEGNRAYFWLGFWSGIVFVGALK